MANTVQRFVRRNSTEVVRALLYQSIDDFETLVDFIGDLYPTLTRAHTRVYENHWIVRHGDNSVEFICCAHGEKCFELAYEPYK